MRSDAGFTSVEVDVEYGVSRGTIRNRLALARASVIHGIFLDWLSRLEDPGVAKSVEDLIRSMSPRVRAYVSMRRQARLADRDEESLLLAGLLEAWASGERLRAAGTPGPFVTADVADSEESFGGWVWMLAETG